MAQALDLVVDRAVLLDVGVGRRDVRFGLIVVEVRDEVLDRVFRKELAELGAELGGERLVVAEHERRLLDELDGPRHRHRLAAAGDPEQRLGAVAPQHAARQGFGRLGLIAGQRKGRDELELLCHCLPQNSLRGPNDSASERPPRATARFSSVETPIRSWPKRSPSACASMSARRSFRSSETKRRGSKSARTSAASEVFVVQSICQAPNGKGVNDAVMELLLMIDALRRASAARITAVIPYYGYAKQDKKTKGREPISAKVIANLLKVTGARRIVTMDLHAAQIQGFFDIPVDNLMAMPVLCNYLKKEGLCDDKIVVVSPDAGGVHRAELFAKRLNSSLAIVFKRRPEPDVAEVTDIVGDVDGKVAVIVDDMISTGGTLAKAAEAIKARGATHVYTVASHGIFAGEAVEVLEQSEIEKVLFTNTIPFEDHRDHPKFVQLSIAQIFADAINRITTNRSVSELFAGDEPSTAPWRPPGPEAVAVL